jgi:hypothetical protein
VKSLFLGGSLVKMALCVKRKKTTTYVALGSIEAGRFGQDTGGREK